MKLFFLFILFILSRTFFLTPQSVFFDAPEYLSRLANHNLLQALASGHPPYHAGYILLFWPVWQITSKLNLNPVLSIEFLTVTLGFLTILVFYKLVKILFNQKVALWSSLLVNLTPYFWITNVSVMVETPYIFFFILSLYFWVLYLKKSKSIYLTLAGFCFGFSWFIHTIIIVWLPAFISCWLLVKPTRPVIPNVVKNLAKRIRSSPAGESLDPSTSLGMTKEGIIFFLPILLFYLINVFLFYYSHIFTLKDAILYGILGKSNEHLSLFPLLTLVPRLLRNWLTLVLRSNTNLLTLLFFISLFWLWTKNQKRFFWALSIWFLPSIVTAQWWDSVLLGRHGIISIFPVSIGSAYFIVRKNVILNLFQDLYRFRNKFGMTRFPNLFVFIIVFYLLITSLGALWLLRQPIPYLEETKAVEKLPTTGLLLETHFARPFVKYKGQLIFINEPGWQPTKLTDLIDQSIKNEQPVFVTSQALNDPYGLYCGPFLNPLSLNPNGQPQLKYLFDQYSFEKIATINKDKNLFIFKIKPKTTSEYFYQNFQIPYLSRQRIDYLDPLTQIWFLLVKSNHDYFRY
jgi:hypothetical protein